MQFKLNILAIALLATFAAGTSPPLSTYTKKKKQPKKHLN
jgi:hypothetical protein